MLLMGRESIVKRMISALVSCFIGAIMAPILHRRFPRVSGVLLAFIPFMIFVGVLSGTITGSLGDGAPLCCT